MMMHVGSRGFIRVTLVFLLLSPAIAMADLPTKSEVIDTMKQVNEFWIAGHIDSGDNGWARATYFRGNMAMYKVYPDLAYYDYALAWAEKHNWELMGGDHTRHADNQCAGQTYLDLNEIDPAPNKIAHIKASIDHMVDDTINNDWWWVDALHMAMPLFTRFGVMFSDDNYFQKLKALYSHTKYTEGGNGLYSDNGHYTYGDYLWWRDGRFDPPTESPNGEMIYWSRGNGWVVAGHAVTLTHFPSSHADYNEYLQTYMDMAASLRDRQQPDGFWYVNLDDPNHNQSDPTRDDGPETSGTAFFTFALAWGLNNGLLSEAEYGLVVENAWHALATQAVQSSGLLGYCQNTAYSPESGQPIGPNDTNDFCVGAFLMAGAEVYKAASGPAPQPTGALQVILTPSEAVSAGAQWRVNGGEWHASEEVQSGLSVGDHTLAFSTVPGWTTPSSQTVTISDGQTTAASGAYTQQTGSLQVTLTPSAAITAGAQWQVDGGDWQSSEEIQSGLSVGDHTLAFSTVPGWTTPSSQTVTISDGQTTAASGAYTQQTGSLQVTLTPSAAVTAGAQWQVDGEDWHTSGEIQSGLLVGDHTLVFNTVQGWTPPGSQTVFINNGATTVASGEYTLEPITNQSPVLDPIGDKSVWETDRLEFVVTANDPDEDHLFFSVANMPLNASLSDHGDGTATFSWQTQEGDYSRYPGIVITVADDGTPVLSDSETFAINVTHDDDADGVSNQEESGPDGTDTDYDGNNDGTPDSLQGSVASLHSYDGSSYVTLYCADGLVNVMAVETPDDLPEDVTFPHGLFQFEIHGLANGANAVVHMYGADIGSLASYYKFGPTLDDASDHFYALDYDDQTQLGAQITASELVLHLSDGKTGDADLVENGMIVDPGGPVVIRDDPTSGPAGGGGGGGCFVFSVL